VQKYTLGFGVNMKIAVFGVGFLGSKLMNFFPNNFEVVGADINPGNRLVKKLGATSIKEVEDFLITENMVVAICKAA
jgi:UDP-N-acetyl-D-mannosaminuronate dehydrogenase